MRVQPPIPTLSLRGPKGCSNHARMSAPDSTTARPTQLRHSLGGLLGGGLVFRHLNISSGSTAGVFLRLSEHQGVRVTYE
jgi:hypothetical protein